MKDSSQRKAILEHLKAHGSITSMEAIEQYGATRLSAVICALRKQGYKIESEGVPFVNRYGNSGSYAKYIYKENN